MQIRVHGCVGIVLVATASELSAVEGIVAQADVLSLGAPSCWWQDLVVAGVVETPSSHIEPATRGVLGGVWLLTLGVDYAASSFIRCCARCRIDNSIPFGRLGGHMSIIWTLNLG
jgi:hypothetical protein